MKPHTPRFPALLIALIAVADASFSSAVGQPLRLSSRNPHYLEWHGRAQLVIGSGEHYGAVLNPDFDYTTYLATLARAGLNHTRTFTGAAYVEPQGAFRIERNTLAPAPGRFLPPWARSSEPGYAGGGNRFDLDHWNEAYFERLRSFVSEAARRRVIVEVNLFCPFYEEAQWKLSPFHPDNNVNGAGRGMVRTNVYTLDRHGGLLAYQEKFVRKVVGELQSADNLYYEICNEAYFGGVTLDWQAHIAALIASEQAGHRRPKLISHNVANHSARVDQPLPNVSILNFHYAVPPVAVGQNRHLDLPIGDNETGFQGTNNAPYRIEAWDFMLAGGALFSHLDYSFTAGLENGTFVYPSTQPGGGNPTLRRQFRILREFLEQAEFTQFQPDAGVVQEISPPTHVAQALVRPKRAVVAYLRPAKPLKPEDQATHSLEVRLNLQPGTWRLEWVDPLTGKALQTSRSEAGSDGLTVQSPPVREDIALRVTR